MILIFWGERTPTMWLPGRSEPPVCWFAATTKDQKLSGVNDTTLLSSAAGVQKSGSLGFEQAVVPI